MSSSTPSRAQPLAQRPVGRHPAADRQPVEPGLRERPLDPDAQRLDDRALVGRGEVGAPALGLGLAELADPVEQRRLQPGEREVEAAASRAPVGNSNALGVAVAREPLERRRRPDSRARAAARPCRTPRRRRRRASGRAPRSPGPRSSTRASSVWPPLAIRLRNGGSNASRREEAGGDVAVQVVDRRERQLARRRERLGASRTPTSSAATSPGPRVTATSSTSGSVAPARSRARRRRRRRSARDGGARRSRGRRRRSGRGRPARRSRWSGSRRRR